jgi:hypothetical protein
MIGKPRLKSLTNSRSIVARIIVNDYDIPVLRFEVCRAKKSIQSALQRFSTITRADQNTNKHDWIPKPSFALKVHVASSADSLSPIFSSKAD